MVESALSSRDLNKVTWKFIWPIPKVKDIFSKLNSVQYFQPWIFELDTITYPLMMPQSLKTAFTSPFVKYKYLKVPFKLAQAPTYFQELMTKVLKDLQFAIA